MAAVGNLHIGTSGWVYRHWRDRFYPEKLAQKHWFEYFARHFDTVEINNSFYRLPTASAVEKWREQAPPNFIYAMKASRYLTHMKKLRDPQEPIERILGRAKLLGPHMGPILYQLPPNWECDLERLSQFIDALPGGFQHVFEFRDPSWCNDYVRHVLERSRMNYCIHDMRDFPCNEWVTGDIAFVRFHGPTHQKYWGRYTPLQMEEWARKIVAIMEAGHDVYAYFNNDDRAFAVENALELRSLVLQTAISQVEPAGR